MKATGCHSDYTIVQLRSEADRKVYGCVEFHDCPIYLDASRVLLSNAVHLDLKVNRFNGQVTLFLLWISKSLRHHQADIADRTALTGCILPFSPHTETTNGNRSMMMTKRTLLNVLVFLSMNIIIKL